MDVQSCYTSGRYLIPHTVGQPDEMIESYMYIHST